LPMVLGARRDGRAFVLPAANSAEASLVPNAVVHPAGSLLAVCAHLAGQAPIPALARMEIDLDVSAHPQLADVRGQVQAKRALTIAAAGGHSLLLIGPPGTGKSMLAQRLPGLLPPLAEEEALATAAIASLAGRFSPSTWGVRPFRAQHHTASAAALTGGGGDPRPGEISLAHHGVLFLDELPEWDRRVLEALREPLESGVIHVSRAARQCTFPAQFQFVAAMNPCPCGWLGHESGRCHCTPDRIARYRARVSGPLLDRIDLGIEVPALSPETIAARGCAARDPPAGDFGSDVVRAQAARARARQADRQGKPNARLGPREIEAHCTPDAAGAALLAQAMARLSLSARAYHRILKVARTIADLAVTDTIGAAQVAEAVGYRRFDRM
jgi:magnesium chelatase family protein